MEWVIDYWEVLYDMQMLTVAWDSALLGLLGVYIGDGPPLPVDWEMHREGEFERVLRVPGVHSDFHGIQHHREHERGRK